MSNEFVLHPKLSNDCVVLMELPLSQLLLCNDSAFPWFILVPKVNNIQDIYQLDWQDQQQLLNESSMLSEVLMQEFKGDKMNVAALGNVVPQLHLHHIVRYKADPCWPKPVWGQQALTSYTDAELNELKERLLPKLSAILKNKN